MFKKLLLFLLSLALSRGELLGQTTDSTAKVGDFAIAELMDDVAKEYVRIKGNAPGSGSKEKLSIGIPVQIEGLLGNGRFRFVNEIEIASNGNNFMIRISGTVEPIQVLPDFLSNIKLLPPYEIERLDPMPSGVKMLRFQIPDLKNVKIQKWKLLEETGE